MSKANPLFKRLISKRMNMFTSEINRILGLIALIKQFCRIKFVHHSDTTQDYLNVVNVLENLIPTADRVDNYSSFELAGCPTQEYVGDLIVSLVARCISKTISTNVKEKLQSINTDIFEPSEILDESESSVDSRESPQQEVPDLEPVNKKMKI